MRAVLDKCNAVEIVHDRVNTKIILIYDISGFAQIFNKIKTVYFGIGIRRYRRMRSVQDFAATALRAVFAAIREAYRNSPIPYSVALTP